MPTDTLELETTKDQTAESPEDNQKIFKHSGQEKIDLEKTEESKFTNDVNELLGQFDDINSRIAAIKRLISENIISTEIDEQIIYITKEIENIFEDSEFLKEENLQNEFIHQDLPIKLRHVHDNIKRLTLHKCSVSREFYRLKNNADQIEENKKKSALLEQELAGIKKELLAKANNISSKGSGIKGLFNRAAARIDNNTKRFDRDQKDAKEIINFFKSGGIPSKLDSISGYLLSDYLPIEDFNLRILVGEYFNHYLSRFQEEESIRTIQDDTANQIGTIKYRITNFLKEIEEKVSKIMPTLKELITLYNQENKWRQYIHDVVFKNFQVSEEDELKYQEPRSELEEITKINYLSFRNIRDSLHHFFAYVEKNGTRYCNKISKEEIFEFMQKEIEIIKNSGFLAITRSESGLKGVLESGCFKSIWDFDFNQQLKKTRSGEFDPHGYLEDRKNNERAIEIQNKNPISCFFESKNGRFANRGPDQYGDYTIILNNQLLNRSVFSEGDSMNINGLIFPFKDFLKPIRQKKVSIKNRTLNLSHAIIAKAMYNLYNSNPFLKNYSYRDEMNNICNSGAEYIEARVLGIISKDDIEYIITANPDKIPKDLQNLISLNKIPIKNQMYEQK